MSGDVLVIGGGISGLTAATYLARAGKHVTLLEAQDRLGGLCAPTVFGEGLAASVGSQTLYALDPRVIADLKLARHGLKFAVRDMALVGLHDDGKHIVFLRDVHATAAKIAVHSTEDARAWPHFRRELFDLARSLRPLWWAEATPPTTEALRRMERIAKMGALAWLDSWFESDVLKAALCFDATEGGLSPIEPGSALTLVWRAAQEMSGLQGAVAMAAGETLLASLIAAARTAGVDIQTSARVAALLSNGETVAGVQLDGGNTLTSSQVIYSLSRKDVLLTMLPPLVAGVAQTARYASNSAATGQARIFLALRNRPHFSGRIAPDAARFILAESTGALARADFAARAGRFGDDLPMEIVISPPREGAADGEHIVSMLARPVPANPVEGWSDLKPKLVERAVAALERLAPGTAAQIVTAKVFAPDNARDLHYQTHTNVEHLLAGYETRITSPLRGLLFCGVDAEPVPAVSGRAARLAATMLTGRK
jgi:phytoene dehydrogenase-like protein